MKIIVKKNRPLFVGFLPDKKIYFGPGGGGGTPYDELYRETPPERGTFFRLEVYKRVGISQAKV